jgi:hypothetical protein
MGRWDADPAEGAPSLATSDSESRETELDLSTVLGYASPGYCR